MKYLISQLSQGFDQLNKTKIDFFGSYESILKMIKASVLV